MKTLELNLLADENAPAAARAEVTGSGMIDNDRLPDVLLLVSELVTNAVKYGLQDTGHIDFRLIAAPGLVRVEIEAGGEIFPLPGDTDLAPRDQPGGMGLRLLRSLADRWGVEPSRSPMRTVVWFELV